MSSSSFSSFPSAASDRRMWSAKCSGSTQLEFLLRGSVSSPGGPLPRGALFEIRRVLAREKIQWGLPRRRNLLILACERGVDLAVVDCLLQAFYRQRRLAMFDGTRKLLVADREAALWAASNAPSSSAAPSSLSILARLFLLDNVDFHDRGSPSLHLPILLAAVRSLDDEWAVQVLLHPRVEPAVAKLIAPGVCTGPNGPATTSKGTKVYSETRRRQRKLKEQRLALGYFIECVRAAIKARMDRFLMQLEAVNPVVTRAAAAYCAAHSTSPLISQSKVQDEDMVPSLLVKRFRRDLLWQQVGALALARMESVRRRKRPMWHFLRVWRQHKLLTSSSGASQASDKLLVVLPDGVFRLIVSFLSVANDADMVLAAMAECDEEDR